MALTVAVATQVSENVMHYKDGTGASDNDVIVQTGDVSRYNVFMLSSTAGALDVFVSLNGTDYTTAALSLTDLGATTSDPVVVTAANRMYGFMGSFAKIQVMQNGATPATKVNLRCMSMQGN
jgi:hypothetical protein